MTVDPEREVPTGAIETALTMAESLHGRDIGGDVGTTLTYINDGIDRWGKPTILDAFGSLIFTAVNTGKWAEGEDALHTLVPAVVGKFQRMQLPEMPDTVLPTVAGLLTAACLQLDPLEWRLSLGPILSSEIEVWMYAVWLLIDFMDEIMFGGREGAFAELLRGILLSGPDDSPTDD